MADKIFVGSGKEKSFDWGSVVSMTLDLDELVRQYNVHGFVNQNMDRKIRITLNKRREKDDYGNTHYVTLDTWHPDAFTPPKAVKMVPKDTPTAKKYSEDDIPF